MKTFNDVANYYIDNIFAFLNNTKIVIDGKAVQPDEKWLVEVETKMNVVEQLVYEYRQSVATRVIKNRKVDIDELPNDLKQILSDMVGTTEMPKITFANRQYRSIDDPWESSNEAVRD